MLTCHQSFQLNLHHVSGPSTIKIYQLSEDFAHDGDYIWLAVDKICDIIKDEPVVDIIVFLPTDGDISQACSLLSDFLSYHDTKGITPAVRIIQPRRSWQNKELEAFDRQTVMFAASVADSSRIDGFGYVVDSVWCSFNNSCFSRG